MFMKRMADVTAVRPWTKLDSDSANELKFIPDGCCVIEFNGPMFFASSEKFSSLPMDDGCRVLIIRMQNVPALDISAVRSLNAIQKMCEEKSISLILSHVNTQPLTVLRKAKFFGENEEKLLADNINAALSRASEICG